MKPEALKPWLPDTEKDRKTKENNIEDKHILLWTFSLLEKEVNNECKWEEEVNNK